MRLRRSILYAVLVGAAFSQCGTMVVNPQTGRLDCIGSATTQSFTVGKWVVANSGSNFQITQPGGTTSTVAKAGATSQNVTLVTLPANSKIISCDIKTTVAYSGTATLTGTVGVTGSVTACVASSYDLEAAVSNSNYSSALPTPIVTFGGTDALLALTSTGQNMSSINAGSVSVWLTYYTLP